MLYMIYIYSIETLRKWIISVLDATIIFLYVDVIFMLQVFYQSFFFHLFSLSFFFIEIHKYLIL